ncbi:hypothetical protein FO519_006485 [Halicephalobus sp. NKZ332]|nr:hypothetical protein FO519_006485 [Halicephalobus sp. NKZ332]
MSAEAETILEDPYSPKTIQPKVEKADLDLITQAQTDSGKTQKQGRPIFFKEKEFKVRPSLLTTSFEGTSGIVFNYVIAIFVLLWMATVVNDIVQHKNPLSHLWLILWNFEKLPLTLLAWTTMAGSTFLVFAGLKFWSLIPSKSVTAVSESFWILGFISYMVGFFYFSLKFLFAQQLNPACSFIITCESTRIAMKTYAFVRENIPRGIERKLALADGREKIRPGEGSKNWPTPHQYLYYFFCPSFLYRDSYPMTESRDWSLVAKHLGQALGCIYFVDLLHIQFIKPYFDTLDYHKITVGELVYSLFPAIIPGSFCLWMLFYGLLHCWLNMFSEAMYFGDRLFYANWWNSRNMAEYYRNWNLVVHEWLYAYVYKDVATLIGGKKGLKVAQVTVFFLSAFFHEFWFGVSLRIFYPIMFVLYFIFGGIFFSVSRLIKVPYVWNIAMWFNLLIGTGMFVSCYATEWYARQRCESQFENAFIDVLVPRLWTC